MDLSDIMNRVVIGVLILTLVLSPMVVPVSGALAAPDPGGTSESVEETIAAPQGALDPGTTIRADVNTSSEEAKSVTDNVSVWVRAPLALDVDEVLYADGSTTNTYVDLPTVTVAEGEDGTPIEYEKDRLPFFEEGKTITATLSASGTGAQGDALDGQNITYVAIRAGDNVPDVEDADSIDDIEDLLNQNGTLKGQIVAETDSFDTNDEIEFTPNESGQYALVAVTPDDGDGGISGPTGARGDLSLDGNVTIVGADFVDVREGDPDVTVDANAGGTGANVTFDVNTTSSFAGDDVVHTVLVFEEDKLAGETFNVIVNESNESVLVETPVKSVRGIARTSPDTDDADFPTIPRIQTTVLGVTVDSGDNITTADDAYALGEKTLGYINESDKVTVVTTGDTVINGSSTTVVDGAETTVDVGTLQEWPAKNYTYFYVGISANDSRTVAKRGEVSLKEGVQLDVSANRSTFQAGKNVKLTLRREDTGAKTNGTLTIEGPSGTTTVETDENGEAVLTLGEVGTYTVTAEKASTTSVDFLADSVDITVTENNEAYTESFSLSATEVEPGEEVTVTFTVKNPTSQDDDETVQLFVDGSEVDTKKVTVPANSEVTETFTLSRDAEGEYDISVDQLPEQTLTVAEPDDDVPEADISVTGGSLSDSSVRTGQSINIKVNVENVGDASGSKQIRVTANGQQIASREVTVGADSTRTVTFSRTFSSVGTRTIRANGVRIGQVTVNARPSGGGGGGGGGGQPGGGGGGPPVDVIETPSGVTVQIGEGRIGQRANVNVGNGVTQSGTGLTGLGVDLGQSTSGFRVEVTPPQANPPAGRPAVDEGRDGARGLFYFEATPRGSDVPVFNGVTYTFQIATSDLPEDVTPQEVVLLRYNETTERYDTLQTTYLGNNTYEAQSPGFSLYAIGVRQTEPSFSIEETSITTRELEVGEETSVEATITNDGDASGTFTANLTVDGEVRDTRSVTLGPGESETVEFTTAFDETGTYDVAISGQSVASVDVVEAQQTPDDSGGQDDGDGSPTPGGSGGSNVGIIGIVLLVGALLVAGGFVLLRRQQQE